MPRSGPIAEFRNPTGVAAGRDGDISASGCAAWSRSGDSTDPQTETAPPDDPARGVRAAGNFTGEQYWPRARPRKRPCALKRQVSNAIFACLQAGARRAAARLGGPGGQQGNDSVASAAGSHPRHRLFGQATPGPGHHPTTVTGGPPPGPGRGRGTAGHSSSAATLPPATPQVQVERPQRSEDERPGGAARRRPHSAASKARGQGSPAKPQRPKGTSQATERTDETP
jgi:hypothetical protein